MISHTLILIMMAAAASAFDYCTITTEHTLCKYNGIGPACGTPKARGVSPAEIATIVATHNRFRSQVATGKEVRGSPGPQPSAANMLEMKWDDELAKEAQMWADQCTFQHDCNDCRKVLRFSVGQNLYISMYSNNVMGSDWAKSVQEWYDEVQNMDKNTVGSYQFSSSTGHYTQVVWGNTQFVGCGYTHYYQDGWYKKFYVCNYGPAGNYISLPVYTAGNTCSSCPSGTSCRSQYAGLCV